jgi:methylmalonyl-CoA mutase N-terminal domain/subunit
MDLFEEVAKFRAARRIWSQIMKERFNAKNPKSLMLRFHVQTAGSSLTLQQPENNIVRTAIEALAAVLGGAQSLHTNSKDEAISLPSEASALTALRTQQIIGYETGITHTVDPFGGSYFIEDLTDKIERETQEYLRRIEEMGGAIKAVENGFIQKEIQESAYQHHCEVQSKQRVVVGVNDFIDNNPETIEIHKVDPELEEEQKRDLQRIKESRDSERVQHTLQALLSAAQGKENVLPFICQSVESYATVGEISNTLRKAFGKFRPTPTL